MARQRFIYPSIWTSPAFAELTLRQRLLFIGMFSLADDYGRGRAEPTRLRMTIFPLDGDLRPQEVGKDCQALRSASLATFYEVGGRRFYSLPGWGDHQRPRHPAKSTIPKPPLETQALPLVPTDKSGKAPAVDGSSGVGRGGEGTSTTTSTPPGAGAPASLTPQGIIKTDTDWAFGEFVKTHARKPTWGKAEYVALTTAVKRCNGDFRERWNAYLDCDEPFFQSHSPRKFLAELDRWTPVRREAARAYEPPANVEPDLAASSQGRQAHAAGVGVNDNPYPRDTGEGLGWSQGWQEAYSASRK